MNPQQSEGLTLRTYPYGESDKIVVFLTRAFGKVRGIAYGAKKQKSRFGSSLEPLTQVRLTFYRKENRELAVIQNCEIIRSVAVHNLTWEVNLHLSYFTELLVEFGKEGEESERLFRLTRAVLESIRGVSIERVARYFELWLLRLEGVLPRLQDRLPAKLVTKTETMLKLHPTRLGDLDLTPEEVKTLESLLGDLIEYHLEKRLKARKLLNELL